MDWNGRLAVLTALALAGCAGQAPPPAVHTVTVNVPVAVSCVPADATDPPASPITTQALAAADGPTRYQMLQEFWISVSPELPYLTGLVDACRSGAPPH